MTGVCSAEMVSCAICGTDSRSNLCEGCASELDNPLPFIAEQVLSAAVRPAGAWLIDVWGRVHPLEPSTTIGRTPVARGMSLFHASISRRHAEVVRERGSWYVHDLNSKCKTRVNGDPITDSALAHGDRVSFGMVGFYFVIDDGCRGEDADHLGSRTLKPKDVPLALPIESEGDATHPDLPRFHFRLVEAPDGLSGFFEARGDCVKLSMLQLQFLRILHDRMVSQAEVHSLARGYVSSESLLSDLPWDSKEPDENHLKQLVRRIRRILDGVGLGGAIESQRGLGYRLRFIPTGV